MPDAAPLTTEQPMQTRAASVRAASANDDTRTVEMVASTGAAARRHVWQGWDIVEVDEELEISGGAIRMERLASGAAPLLQAHRHRELTDQIGVIERARVEAGQLVVTARFSRREDADAIWRDVADGIIRSVSVGYVVHEAEITERRGQRPLYRAIDWEPMEVSLVSVSADPGAQVRSATPDTRTYPLRLRGAHLRERGAMPDNAPTDPAPTPDLPTVAPPPPTPVDEVVLRQAAAQAERQRIADIEACARITGYPEIERRGLIDNGTALEEARTTMINWAAAQDQGTPTRSHLPVQVETDEVEKWTRGAANAILQRAGVARVVAQHEPTAADLDPGEMRGSRILDLARDCLERSSIRARGLSQRETIARALSLRSGPHQTTSDFAVLLENTMHRVLQAAYATTPDTWSRFCDTGSVTDFKPSNRYRMGVFGKLDKLNEEGEFKNKPILDAEKELLRAATIGNIIALSREAMINDDLGAFNRMAMQLGRAARLSVEIDVYALFALNGGNGPTMSDGKALFHADHNNIAAPVGAPTVDTFEGARLTMATQRDPWDNDYLDLRPSIWVGPIGLGGDARVVNDAQYDPDTANKLQKPNKVRGLFQDIVDTPRLSGTPWYGFANPAVAPAIEVAFLEGEAAPYLESRDGWRTDGVEWKVRFDYGVAAIDFRPVVRNAGA